MTREVLFGVGASRRVSRVLDSVGARRIFLVTGRASFERSGAADAFEPLTPRLCGRYCEFTENPKLEEALEGAAAFRRASPDAIVAAGGGSALDMAKLIATLAHYDGDASALVRGQVPAPRRAVPFVALPTTSGSGSEATHFAVVYDGHSKYSLAHRSLRPDVAIVDPALTFSLSPRLTAITGLDAFAQAVESYWSVHSTAASRAYARRAIQLVLGSLSGAVHAPTPATRRAMSKAAHLAGRAINLTKTTAAHALSYPLTSYFGIPHGHAVALTLGQLLLYNSGVAADDVNDARGAAFVRRTIDELVALLGARTPEDACRRVEALTQDVGLPTRLSELGISRRGALDAVVPNVNAERVVNNPRALSAVAVHQLIEAVS
jgi:alcohol dehydrogenase class IV